MKYWRKWDSFKLKSKVKAVMNEPWFMRLTSCYRSFKSMPKTYASFCWHLLGFFISIQWTFKRDKSRTKSKNSCSMSPKVEKFKDRLTCLKEIDFFLKTQESKPLMKNQVTVLSLRQTRQVIKWLKLIESKCFTRLMKFLKCILKLTSTFPKMESSPLLIS